MTGGYIGKILQVDLSSGIIEDEVLDEQLYRDFVGGYGLASRLIYYLGLLCFVGSIIIDII